MVIVKKFVEWRLAEEPEVLGETPLCPRLSSLLSGFKIYIWYIECRESPHLIFKGRSNEKKFTDAIL
jgi:hypothetical protein